MASIDVVIPSYQYGRYLGECIRSVLTQGIDDLRILVIDNASTDDSVAIARQFAAEDPRIEVRAREKNLGPHASFNEGVDWAESDYFTLLCADDYLTPGSLTRSIGILEKYPSTSFAFGGYIILESEGGPDRGLDDDTGEPSWRIHEGHEFISKCCDRMVLTVSPVMRTSILKRAGHFRPELYYYDDLEMLLRLAYLGPVAETTAKQAVQRLHQSNISRGTWEDALERFNQEEAMYESFFTHDAYAMPEATTLRRRARRNVGKHVYWSAVAQLSSGRKDAGMKLMKYAFKLCPSTRIFPPIDYLFQIDNPINRIAKVLSDGFGMKRAIQPVNNRQV